MYYPLTVPGTARTHRSQADDRNEIHMSAVASGTRSPHPTPGFAFGSMVSRDVHTPPWVYDYMYVQCGGTTPSNMRDF